MKNVLTLSLAFMSFIFAVSCSHQPATAPEVRSVASNDDERLANDTGNRPERSYKFSCIAIDRRNGFLVNSKAVVTVNDSSLSFQEYDVESRSLRRDYRYKFTDFQGGRGQMRGMMTFDLEEEIKSYGDNIHTIYVERALLNGNDGKIAFKGHGYKWDWNSCTEYH